MVLQSLEILQIQTASTAMPHGAGADWDFLRYLRDRWPNKLVIKGVLNIDDAINMKGMGVDGIYVSSHGGRQLASAPHPIEMLPKIREALGKKCADFL